MADVNIPIPGDVEAIQEGAQVGSSPFELTGRVRLFVFLVISVFGGVFLVVLGANNFEACSNAGDILVAIDTIILGALTPLIVVAAVVVNCYEKKYGAIDDRFGILILVFIVIGIGNVALGVYAFINHVLYHNFNDGCWIGVPRQQVRFLIIFAVIWAFKKTFKI